MVFKIKTKLSHFEIHFVQKWVSYFHRTAQPRTLAPFPTWGIQQELVVKDLPTAKVTIIFILQLNSQNL